MRPAAGELDQPYPLSLEVLAQVIVVPFAYHNNWRVLFVGVMAVAASVEALPVDDEMLADGGFPVDESLPMAGNPG